MIKIFSLKKLIKRIFVSILIILIFVCIAQYIKEVVFSDPERILENISPSLKYLAYLPVKERVYDPDRTITYSLSYMNIIPIGRADFSAQEKGNYILLKAEAKVSDFINNLYEVDAKAFSLIDKNKFYPYKYIEKTTFDIKKKEKEIIFYPDKNIAERDGKKYKIPPMTFCPLSAFYYLQLQDLTLYRSYKIKLLSKEEIYVLEARVTEESDDIVLLEGEVRRQDLSSNHGASFEIYMSKKYRVPLLMKIKTAAGIIIARAII